MKEKIKMTSICIFCLLSLSWIKQIDEFVFQNENQKLSIQLDGGKKSLHWNVPTRLKVFYDNIDPEKITFSAPGISFIKSKRSRRLIFLKITPDKNLIKGDTLKLQVTGRDLNNLIWSHRFKIFIED